MRCLKSTALQGRTEVQGGPEEPKGRGRSPTATSPRPTPTEPWTIRPRLSMAASPPSVHLPIKVCKYLPSRALPHAPRQRSYGQSGQACPWSPVHFPMPMHLATNAKAILSMAILMEMSRTDMDNPDKIVHAPRHFQGHDNQIHLLPAWRTPGGRSDYL